MYFNGDPDAVYDLPPDKRERVLAFMYAEAIAEGRLDDPSKKPKTASGSKTAAQAHGV